MVARTIREQIRQELNLTASAGVAPNKFLAKVASDWRKPDAVLCNLYKNGNDKVGLHADSEPEMGPVIASVSLGAERLFRLKTPNGAIVFAERLPHGSLFIMAGPTQKNFKHEAPKESDVIQPRVNLTFRRIERS